MTTTTRTAITNQHCVPIGFLETTGTVTTILNRHNVPLGTYDSKTNWTKNLHGTPLGQGNLLVTLLPPQRR
jgi:hypothetical protein